MADLLGQKTCKVRNEAQKFVFTQTLKQLFYFTVIQTNLNISSLQLISFLSLYFALGRNARVRINQNLIIGNVYLLQILIVDSFQRPIFKMAFGPLSLKRTGKQLSSNDPRTTELKLA